MNSVHQNLKAFLNGKWIIGINFQMIKFIIQYLLLEIIDGK